MTKRTGEVCFLRDIVTETGFTADQVQAAVWHLVKHNGEAINIVTRGQSWRYTGADTATEPEPADSLVGTVFECIGTSKNGAILVRGEDGNLYVLRELEI